MLFRSPHEYEVGGIELREGRNVLVLKVFNAGGRWQAGARLLGAGEEPVEGVTITSKPD